MMDDDDGTRGEHCCGYEQQRKGTLHGYTICLSVCLSFFSYMQAIGQHVHRRRKYVGYTTCLLFISAVISLLSPTCWLWRTRKMVAMTTGQEDNTYITEESTLAIQPVCCLFLLLSFCCLSAMCRMGRRKFMFTYRKNEERKKYGQKQTHERLQVSIPLHGISLPEQPSLDDMVSLPVSPPTSTVVGGRVESVSTLRRRLNSAGVLPRGRWCTHNSIWFQFFTSLYISLFQDGWM